jgi:hypothetical protein
MQESKIRVRCALIIFKVEVSIAFVNETIKLFKDSPFPLETKSDNNNSRQMAPAYNI